MCLISDSESTTAATPIYRLKPNFLRRRLPEDHAVQTEEIPADSQDMKKRKQSGASILDSEDSWSVKDTDHVSCSESEFSEKEAKQVKRKKKRVYVTGKRQRKEVLIQKDVPVLSEPYVNDSESEMSEACVSDNMSVRFPLLTESNAVSNSSESEAETEDIIRDIDNSKIYIKALKQSSTTKQGKKKKNDRVFNATHACPFCDNLMPNFSRHIIEMHGDRSRVKAVLKIEVKGKNEKKTFKKTQKIDRSAAISG